MFALPKGLITTSSVTLGFIGWLFGIWLTNNTGLSEYRGNALVYIITLMIVGLYMPTYPSVIGFGACLIRLWLIIYTVILGLPFNGFVIMALLFLSAFGGKWAWDQQNPQTRWAAVWLIIGGLVGRTFAAHGLEDGTAGQFSLAASFAAMFCSFAVFIVVRKQSQEGRARSG